MQRRLSFHRTPVLVMPVVSFMKPVPRSHFYVPAVAEEVRAYRGFLT